jgi:hypothetical protein
MAGLAQRGGKPLARLQPADVLPAAGRLERAHDPACYIERFLVEAEAALVASHRVRGVEGVHVISAEDLTTVLNGALIGLQGLRELTEQPVVNRDVAPDIQRAFVIYAKNNFKFISDTKVKSQRLAELAVRAQVRAVEVLAEQERLEPLTIGIAL